MSEYQRMISGQLYRASKIEKEYEGQGNIAEQVIEESVIDKVNEKLDEVLLNISLEDLEKDYLQSNDFSQYMYYI